MPLQIDPAMIEQLVHREIQHDRIKPKLEAPAPETKPMSPKMAMLLGGAADVASTYAFLKRGTATEDQKALQFLNKSPAKVFALGAGMGIGSHLLHELVKRKAPKLADTLAGGIGGYQMALGGVNTEAAFGETRDMEPDQLLSQAVSRRR